MIEILEMALAFAVTMLSLATVVTLLMEIVARLTRRRSRLLKHMLRKLYTEEFEALFGPSSPDQTATMQAFVESVQRSPLDQTAPQSALSKLSNWLVNRLHVDEAEQLSRTEFLSRLARSKVGQRIQTSMAAETDRYVEYIGFRFDELAAAATERVKGTSSVLSLTIGIALAFTCNIDGYRLASHFIDDPQAARLVASKADQVVKTYEAAEARLQQVAEQAADNALEEDLEAAQRSLAEIQAQLDELHSLGLPFGVEYFPYCRYGALDDHARYPCKGNGPAEPLDDPSRGAAVSTVSASKLFFEYLLWAFRVAITGILIGLGGPFWYDAVRGLTRTLQMARGRSDAASSAVAVAGSPDSTPGSAAIFKASMNPLDTARAPTSSLPVLAQAAAVLESLSLRVGDDSYLVVEARHNAVADTLHLSVRGQGGVQLGDERIAALQLATARLIDQQLPKSAVEAARIVVTEVRE